MRIWLFALLLAVAPFGFGALLDDGRLDCGEISTHKAQIFSENFKIYNFNTIDFECENSLLKIRQVKNLLDIAMQIRGETRTCTGKNADINLNSFKFILLKAGNAPEIYAKSIAKPEIYEPLLEQDRAFFRYWGHQTLSNFLLFKKFNKSFNDALDPMVRHYTSNFRIDEGSAIYYATKVANEFLKFAIDLKKSDFNGARLDISDFQKRVADPKFSKYDINEMIYSGKISKEGLQSAFDTALLYEKSKDILQEFIRVGVDLNADYESSLFFALKNLDNVNFLLDNGARVDYANLLGQTPLFKAVGMNDAQLVKLLVRNGANVNNKTIDLNTKLAYVSNLGEILPSHVKPCDFEHTSRTIFMEAASGDDVEILKFLVAIGVEIDALDDAGFNALDYAKAAKKEANVQYLKSLGLKSNFNEGE